MRNNSLFIHPAMNLGLPAGEPLFSGDKVYINAHDARLYRATETLNHGRIWCDYKVGEKAWFIVERECVIEVHSAITVNAI